MKKIVIAVMAIALLAGCASEGNGSERKACKDAFTQADEGFQLASVAILAAVAGDADKMNQITAVLTQLQPEYQSNKDKCING